MTEWKGRRTGRNQMKMENLSTFMYIAYQTPHIVDGSNRSTTLECDPKKIDFSFSSIFRLYSFGNWKCLLRISNCDLSWLDS